jgi:trimeric autotransporter adhesin
MSTKTTFKRIALVAVAALGLGVLSVAPSSAAPSAASMTGVASGSVGSPVTLSVAQTIVAGDTAMGTLTISSKPASSTVAIGDRDGAFSTATAAVLTSTAAGFTYDSVTAGTAAITAGSATSFAATVTIVPDVVGAYTITWTPDGGAAIHSVIYAWAAAPNGASLVGILADGGYPSSNGFVNGVAGPANTVTLRAFPSVPSATVPTPGRRLISVEGTGAYLVSGLGYDATHTPSNATDANAALAGANATFPAGATAPTTATIPGQERATAYTDFVVATPAVGTVTVRIFSETAAGSGIFSATAAGTVVITVAATASSGTTSVSLSSVLGTTVNDSSAATLATDAAVGSIPGTGAPAFAVRYQIVVKDILGANRAASATALTASVSGPGLLGTSNSAASASRAIQLTWDGTSEELFLFNDGTSGTSTVTVSFGTTVLATKTVIFTGAARTLTATAWEPHITVGSASEALEVVAKDANGNITSWTPTVLSSAPSVIASSLTCARATAAWALSGYTPGAYYCDLSGLSVGTATLTVAPGSLTTNSPTVDFRVTKSVIASATFTTDKAEYAPGEKITLILTAKDADGNLIGAKAAGAKYDALAADSTVSSSITGSGFCGANALTTTCTKNNADATARVANPGTYLSAGVAKATYYAPLVSGPVTFRGTMAASSDVAAAAQLSALSVTVNVSQTTGEVAAQAAADAAAEATDAANAATDAANAAAEAADAATAAAQDAADAVAALSTQVTELVSALRKQITSLTNLVIKIQRKVRA